MKLPWTKAKRIAATATLWEEVLPVDRGERYEDPLDEALAPRKLGEVTGGGSQLGESSVIEYVDIELDLVDSGEAIALVMRTLTGCGAPKHSRLRFERDGTVVEHRFGVAEGVSMTFPTEPIELVEQVAAALGEDRDLRGGYTTKDGRYLLYAYDVDAERSWSLLEPVLRAHPAARGASIVVRCGHVDGKPRAFRLE